MRSRSSSKILCLLLVITFFAMALPEAVAEDSYTEDMISYWRLDDGSGFTAEDSVGTNHGALVNGPVWTSGQVEGALDLDGVDQYVQVPSSEDWNVPAGDFTLSMWVYQEGTSTYFYGLMGHGGFYCGGGGWNLVTLGCPCSDLKNVGFLTFGENGMYQTLLISTGTIPLYEWNFVNVVQSGDTTTIFLNGASSGSGTVGSYVPTSDTLEIGAIRHYNNYCSPHHFFDGSLDEVAIYERALSAEEILEHYENGLEGKDYCQEEEETSEEAIEDLIEDVEDTGLRRGNKKSLVSKLENTLKSLEKGNEGAAVNQLEAFINEVEAQIGKKLSEEEAQVLIEAAQAIIDLLTS